MRPHPDIYQLAATRCQQASCNLRVSGHALYASNDKPLLTHTEYNIKSGPRPGNIYIAKNEKVAKRLLTSFIRFVINKPRSHGMRQLVNDRSVASCQQTCCKLIFKTCYQQACCKLFQQVVTSLILTGLLQHDEIDKFVSTRR